MVFDIIHERKKTEMEREIKWVELPLSGYAM